MIARLLAGVFAILLAGAASAADFDKHGVATTGGDFLTFDTSARGIALGGAYTALTNDANSIYWNPAGLAKIARFSSSFQYARYVQDISYQNIAAAGRMGDLGVIGAGWRYRDVGKIDYTGVSGENLGSFRPRDYVFEVGWGQSIYDLSDSELDINMGVSAKWLRQTIVDDADSFGGDIGIQARYYSGSRAYDFGFALQNMGIGSNFDSRRDTLPFRVRLGAVAYPIRALALALEGVAPSYNVPYAAVGAEYNLEVTRELKAAVRAGFNSMTVQSLGVPSGFSAGFGLQLADLSFDYAFVPMGVLGAQVHRMTINFNLPAKISRRYRER